MWSQLCMQTIILNHIYFQIVFSVTIVNLTAISIFKKILLFQQMKILPVEIFGKFLEIGLSGSHTDMLLGDKLFYTTLKPSLFNGNHTNIKSKLT